MFEDFKTKIDREYKELKLKDIFERRNGEIGIANSKYFNSEAEREDSQLKYRIPEHQRFQKWNNSKKQRIVETVLSNFPMSGIIVSRHVKNAETYYDIEDGQSRLTILQQFYNDEFPIKVGSTNFKFSELEYEYRNKFEEYKINIEVIDGASNEQITDIFERLQEGQPLKDEDKYWNRKDDAPLVKYAFELIQKEYWDDENMGTVKGITSSNRRRIRDVCGLIGGILYGETCIRPNWSIQFPNIHLKIGREQKEKIKKFLLYYNDIIDTCFQIQPKVPTEKNRQFYNLGKDLGMIIYDYFYAETEMTTDQKKDMWVHTINVDRRSRNYMKGKQKFWEGLKSGEKRNCTKESLRARVDRVRRRFKEKHEYESESESEPESDSEY